MGGTAPARLVEGEGRTGSGVQIGRGHRAGLPHSGAVNNRPDKRMTPVSGH